ncbi:MAG: ABC transporter ATP-binding protein [Candidatus Contendobacter sp.]|nr:ABC transporter ATP-binding protein [Candidatus Contendobacter sp.]MDG4556643.1 ABC transporter ATP-binding protein [Candidatus Contendobacter sp.]
MASLAFEHIDKTYPGGTQAIFDFNLAVADGEVLALVGPSGCGKSTLLRLLAGLDDATRGDLRIGGEVVNDLPPQRRNVAMVFQDYALYPHMTVRGNLEFPLKMRNLPRAEIARQVAWAAELLGLDGLLDRLPRQLSGGQRQRVAMGRALVRQPAAFLMDEPLSNLDARLRVQIRAELSELLDRLGATTLYVTHDQAEAMTLGDRVAVLDCGRLQQAAPPQILYEQPANTFVAGFIGNPPMNLFPARLTAADGGLGLRLGEQTLPLALSTAVVERWRAWLDAPLTFGVRPEHLHLAGDDGEGVRATVSDAEYLGHETLLHVRVDDLDPPGAALVARLPGIRPFHKGEAVCLSLDAARLHGFGPDGKALDGFC